MNMKVLECLVYLERRLIYTKYVDGIHCSFIIQNIFKCNFNYRKITKVGYVSRTGEALTEHMSLFRSDHLHIGFFPAGTPYFITVEDLKPTIFKKCVMLYINLYTQCDVVNV